MKNNYHHSTFVQYKKKLHQFISFSLYEKKLNKRKEKKSKEAKKNLVISGCPAGCNRKLDPRSVGVAARQT
jgi:ferredoxin-like protein FixX